MKYVNFILSVIVIFLLILAAIIVLILFFRILLKFNSIRKKWLLYLQKRAYKKNADDAVKKIKRLLKTSKVTDIEFCSSIQAITRQYLDFRFDFRFSAISSSSIPAVFEKICAGQIPSEISEAVDNITSMFIRTDYIRYAHDSIDSQLYPPQEHQAALIKNERRQLVQMILNAIEAYLERKHPDKKHKHHEFIHELALLRLELGENRMVISRSLSFGLMLFCLGFILTTIYLLSVYW